MVLTPELVEYAKKEVRIEQYFELTDKPTAKHLLFKEFIEKTKWSGLPKIIFYILMDEIYPQAKDADGQNCLGYKVKLKSEIPSTSKQ